MSKQLVISLVVLGLCMLAAGFLVGVIKWMGPLLHPVSAAVAQGLFFMAIGLAALNAHDAVVLARDEGLLE